MGEVVNYSPAARAGITFYLVRAMYWEAMGDERQAWQALLKGLSMVYTCGAPCTCKVCVNNRRG